MAAGFFPLPQLPKFHIPQKMTSFYRPRRSTSEHQAVLQRKMSMSLVNKGLLNPTGENNCFLNSAVQVLWHIDIFRRSFREFKGHTCVGESCIFCSLKSLFNDIQYSELAAIPPDNLRQSMAHCYKEQHRFQLGLMDDAAECFEKLLEQIHYHLTASEDMDICGAMYCLSHQKFALTILERTECVCGATSEPLSFVQFVHYISSAAIVKEAQKLDDTSQKATPTSTLTDEAQVPVTTPTPGHVTSSLFGRVLNAASAFGEFRECPNFKNCKKTVSVKRILMNAPDVVCLGLIWDSDQPPVSDIMAVVNTIGLTLRLNEVFDQVITDGARINEYHLTALIAYYGRHYSTFCYHGALKEWTYFDDAKFRTIGNNWSDVCEEIRKAHYQPLLLVYSNPFAEPLDVSEASKKVTVVTTSNHDNHPKPTPIVEESKLEPETSTNQIQDGKESAPTNQIQDDKENAPTNQIQDDKVSASTNQIEASTSDIDNKPVTIATEMIDPLTFSIVPANVSKQSTNQNAALSKVVNQAGHAQEKTTSTGSDWEAQFSDTPSVAMTTQSSSSETAATPSDDLMSFSISPVTIATAQRNVAPPAELPLVQTTSPQSNKDNSHDADLIEFSLFPNSFYKKLSTTSPTTSTVASSDVHALPANSKPTDIPVSHSHSSGNRSNSKTSELNMIWEHFAEPDTPTSPPQDPLPRFPTPPPAVNNQDSWAMISTGGTVRSVSPDPLPQKNSPALRSLKRVSSYHEQEKVKVQSPVTGTKSRAIVTTATTGVSNTKLTQSTPNYVVNTGSHGNAMKTNVSTTSSNVVGKTSSVTNRPWRVIQTSKGSGQTDRNRTHNYTEVVTNHRGVSAGGRGKSDPLYDNIDAVPGKTGSGHGSSVKSDLVYAELDFQPKVPNQQNATSKVLQTSHASHMTHKGSTVTASEQRKNTPIGLDPLYAVPEQVLRRLEAAQKKSPSTITSQSDKTGSTGSVVSSSKQTNPWMLQGKLQPQTTSSSVTGAVSHDRYHGNNKVPLGADPLYAVPNKPKFNQKNSSSNSSHITRQSYDQTSRIPIGQDAVPEKVKAPQQATRRLHNTLASSDGSHDSHVTMKSRLSSIPSSTIMSLSELSRVFLIRARDLWAKAEASLDNDTTVALMLFTQCNNLLSKLVQAEDVKMNSFLFRVLKDAREEGLKMCDILRPSQSTGGSHGNSHVTSGSSIVSQGSCKRCGRTRNLDTQFLCGPCKLRVQLGQH